MDKLCSYFYFWKRLEIKNDLPCVYVVCQFTICLLLAGANPKLYWRVLDFELYSYTIRNLRVTKTTFKWLKKWTDSNLLRRNTTTRWVTYISHTFSKNSISNQLPWCLGCLLLSNAFENTPQHTEVILANNWLTTTSKLVKIVQKLLIGFCSTCHAHLKWLQLGAMSTQASC